INDVTCVADNCTNYELVFERVFSVPGDAAMLYSTLLSPDVFNFTAVPFNITWFSAKTGQEMRNETGRILVLQETLWFLNTTLDDDGEYLAIVRTPSQCYMQTAKLVMDQPVAGECGRPRKDSRNVGTNVVCRLSDYIHKLKTYGMDVSVSWYKVSSMKFNALSERIKCFYSDKHQLIILDHYMVKVEGSGAYTCTLTFTLDGATRSVSETMNATVTAEQHFLPPQIHEPENEIIKAAKGSNFTKRCLVFVPGAGKHFVDVIWLDKNKVMFDSEPSDRIYTSALRSRTQDEPKGEWLELLLNFSELRQEDFYLNYTCRVFNYQGNSERYFTLLPTDPNIILPIGLVFGGVTVLFVISVIVYYIFRIDIVLCFRRAFPVLYTNKDLDGKLYDAYVAYPSPGAFGFSEEVEKFALQTLPEVLEQACGYKLFIAGRDCLPGQAIVDSVDENLQASRRVLLLYTASTFIKKRHTSSTSTSMNRALLEGSLKVILVELEEITPAQLALFPESVRHLRKKQGAVCWYEERRGKDSQVSPSLSPSSRFWKEIRYHMPVRGKRAAYPE
uniref:Zmp:0000000936 n=1 Tax=Poecilia formosa TaxID=48698 RepID=A0A087YHW2_POEFO